MAFRRRIGTWAKRGALAFVAVIVVALGVGFALESTRWRLFLIGRKLFRGEVREVTWGELFHMIGPNSRYYLRPVISEGRSVNGAIQNPFVTATDEDEGGKIYRARCAPCHGQDGLGDRGPPLNRPAYTHGNADWVVYRIVERGIAETGMPPSGMDEEQIWRVIAFLRKRQNEAAGGAHLAPETALHVHVAHDDLIAAPKHGDEWLTYSRTFDGWRYSPLGEITASNVASLRLRWVHQLATNDPIVEATPLVAGGAMFVSVPPSSVVALDARTGNPIWHFGRDMPHNMSLCCGRVNRGVALLGATVYVGTLDAYLVALDAATGAQRWETKVADVADGYSITVAPLAIGDLVIAGVSGGEFGVRGFLAAYAADTGKEVWRFNTVPGPDEPGHDTWDGDSWKTGGAPTWVTGAYDPELDLVYWGVGNPSPIYSGVDRKGDNLYSNSVIALSRRTGKLVWHFQFSPHDEHDWDSNQTPILADLTVAGTQHKAIGWANRNGFYYLLDRVSGAFLVGKPFVKQTWAKGLDSHGRPILVDGGRPTRKGALVFPGVAGGTNWQSAAFHPGLGSIFIPATEGSSIFTNSPPETHQPGALFVASGALTQELEPMVKALDAATGEPRWEYREPRARGIAGRSGLLTTAGDLVFGACEGQLFALDARTGAELWRIGLGGITTAAPISFAIGGHQAIAIAAGRSLFVFSL
ncbi:MAG TPA: PQQ-dependent dehydrogenase, methanol/ethanol family [Kofleriaceae bacterium]